LAWQKLFCKVSFIGKTAIPSEPELNRIVSQQPLLALSAEKTVANQGKNLRRYLLKIEFCAYLLIFLEAPAPPNNRRAKKASSCSCDRYATLPNTRPGKLIYPARSLLVHLKVALYTSKFEPKNLAYPPDHNNILNPMHRKLDEGTALCYVQC
jgi:hypothetical protein